MSEVLSEPNKPIKEGLERLFMAVDNDGKKIRALSTAIVEREDISPILPGEELAEYDTVTQRGKLRFEQDIIAFQHQEILDTAGLQFERNVFGGGLCIKDGEKFLGALALIPETSDTLRHGLKRIMMHFLHKTSSRLVPDAIQFEKDTFFNYRYAPQLQRRMDKDDATGEQARMAVEVMLCADDITAQLERLNVHKQVLRDFDALRIAEFEDMLPEWAEAYHWGIFTPPTEEDRRTVWRQWGRNQHWTAYFQYLDSCKAKAPANSKFMVLIADGMNSNITKLRNGELEPEDELERKRREERRRRRDANRANAEEWINAESDSYIKEDEAWHRSQQEKWQREYDRNLEGVQLRLQPYLKHTAEN